MKILNFINKKRLRSYFAQKTFLNSVYQRSERISIPFAARRISFSVGSFTTKLSKNRKGLSGLRKLKKRRIAVRRTAKRKKKKPIFGIRPKKIPKRAEKIAAENSVFVFFGSIVKNDSDRGRMTAGHKKTPPFKIYAISMA
jgi:hypothetical protein